MTLQEAIEQFSEIGRGDDVRASQARQMAAWLKELRELRNKMRGVEALFGKGQIENLRREMRKMSAAAEVLPAVAQLPTIAELKHDEPKNRNGVHVQELVESHGPR